MDRPPLSATAVPVRTARWDSSSQQAILRHELLELAFYRRLISAEEDLLALLWCLEEEFDVFVARAGDDEPETVCLRFPPMPPCYRLLVHKLAERYYLQSCSFGEDDKRFCVVYKHLATARRPVLRLADFMHAKNYYSPQPAPEAKDWGKRQRYERREKVDIELEAPEVPLTADFSRWQTGIAKSPPGEDIGGRGFECEIAECHDHLVEIRSIHGDPLVRPDALAAESISAVRSLPNGWLAVFPSSDAARMFLDAKRDPASNTTDSEVQLRLGIDDAVTHLGRIISVLQHRPRRDAGRSGAPRALMSAMRGIGQKQGRGSGQKRC